MPGTTPAGLPYPLPTEPVADGADAIKALAEAVDPHILDTGWTPLTVANGTTAASGSQQLAIRKIGNLVVMRGEVWAVTAAALITTIPAAFRPDQRSAFRVIRSGSGSYATESSMAVWVQTDGTVRMDAAVGASPPASPGYVFTGVFWLRPVTG